MKRLVQAGVLLCVTLLLLQTTPTASVAAALEPVVLLPTSIVDSADLVANATAASDLVIQIDTMPHTVVTLSVNDYIKGESTSTVNVLVAGGLTPDGRNVSVSHTPRFRIGQQVQIALVVSTRTSLSESLVEAEAIATPLYEIVGGEEGVVEAVGTGFEARASGIDDFFVNPGPAWSSFTPPVSYRVNTQGSGLSSAATLAAVNRAAQAWEDDLGSVIDLDYAGPTTKSGFAPGDGVNVVSFQYLPLETYVAFTSSFPNSDGTHEFDIVLNTRYVFSDGAVPDRYDLEMVLTHEFGHVLGLGHPSRAGSSQEVMFKFVPRGAAKKLGSGDRAGIRFLYPTGLPVVPCTELAVTVDLNTGVGAPTDGDDVILGTPGPDWIWALGGNDIICGGGGIDRIFAGQGDDQVFGEGGSDRIWGEAGNDVIYAGSGADRVWAGEGDDVIFGQGGQDFLFGEAGNDELQGNWQSDQLNGGPGNDDLRGAGGKDIIYGDGGDDTLFGGLNTDYLNGGDGFDVGDGQRGRDNPISAGVSGCEQLETSVSC